MKNTLCMTLAALIGSGCAISNGKKEIISKYKGISIEAIQKSINTLKEAQKFSEAVYGVNRECPKGAGLISYLLKDNGYPAKFVRLEKEGWGFHWFFMYENRGKCYFADNGLFGIVKCNSAEELKSYVENKDDVKGLAYKITEKAPPEFESQNVKEDINLTEDYLKRKDI